MWKGEEGGKRFFLPGRFEGRQPSVNLPEEGKKTTLNASLRGKSKRRGSTSFACGR